MTSWLGHEPVMADEILEVFDGLTTGTVVDATVGGGGHADALLEAHPHVHLVGFDQDADAIVAAGARLARHGARVALVRARFDRLDAELDLLGVDSIVGVVFDLGISSHQVDAGPRGFSYRSNGPLDMRMDQRSPFTAARLVNESSEADLVDLLHRFGDERHARRIARAIIAARPVETTGRLADIVRDAIPAPARRHGGHPAKRTFQALRIAVNDELGTLERALDQAIERLAPGGRGAVLTYHSGEDRLVKHRLRAETGRAPAGRPPHPDDPPARLRLLAPGGRTPGAAELGRNPRAASARLRAFERLPLEQVAA